MASAMPPEQADSQEKSWRLLLRPSWILLAIVVACFSVACFTVLSPWQLGKGDAADQRNDQLEASHSAAPVPLNQLQPAGAPLHQDNIWRAVSVTGTYLGSDQVALKMRSADPAKATEILTPFQIAGSGESSGSSGSAQPGGSSESGGSAGSTGSTESTGKAASERVVMVNRGFVANREAGAAGVIPPAPDGAVTILGWIQVPEGTSPYKEPKVEDAQHTAYTVDVARLAGEVGLGGDVVTEFYLQLAPEQPGSLGTIARPEVSSGPYRSYGYQWLVLGVLAPLLLVVFAWRRVKSD